MNERYNRWSPPKTKLRTCKRYQRYLPWSQDWPIAAGAYPGFCSVKRLEMFLLPLDGMLVNRRSLPRNLLGFPSPGLEPGPLAPESSALTKRPPCLPHIIQYCTYITYFIKSLFRLDGLRSLSSSLMSLKMMRKALYIWRGLSERFTTRTSHLVFLQSVIICFVPGKGRQGSQNSHFRYSALPLPVPCSFTASRTLYPDSCPCSSCFLTL